MIIEWFVYKFLTLKKTLPPQDDDMDSDVKGETERIKNMDWGEIASGNLVLKGLSKFYGNHLAVNQLYLSVDASECFGLLGINGNLNDFLMIYNQKR